MRVLGAVQLALLAALLFTLTGALVATPLVRLAVPRIRSWSPEARHRGLGLLAALPGLIAALLLLACFTPSLMAVFVPTLDHCAVHDDGHPHMCLIHLPRTAGSLGGWALLAGLAGGLVFLVLRALWRLRRAGALVDRLLAAARLDQGRDVLVVPSERALCLAAGLRAPRVVVSAGLIAATDSETLAAVVEHERAHARRRDALVRLLARASAMLHLPALRRLLLEELEVAAEQACDETAAIRLGDRAAVAAAILRVARLVPGEPTLAPLAAGIGPVALERRVTALLTPARQRGSVAPLVAVLVVAAGLVFAASGYIHHFTESQLAHLSF